MDEETPADRRPVKRLREEQPREEQPLEGRGRSPRRRLGLLVAALALLVVAGVWLSRRWTPPHVVLVVVDSLRVDHTSLGAYQRLTTPHIQRIGALGMVLRSHFANAPWAKPSVASLFTGLHPTAHGCRTGGLEGEPPGTPMETLAPHRVTLAEALGSAGYATWGWAPHPHLDPARGFGQGFEEYLFRPEADPLEADRRGVEAALEVLRSADKPTFVYLHLVSPAHLAAPEEISTGDIPGSALQRARVRAEEQQRLLDDYDRSVIHADRRVGDLFDALEEEAPGTVLVITASQGLELLRADRDEVGEEPAPEESAGEGASAGVQESGGDEGTGGEATGTALRRQVSSGHSLGNHLLRVPAVLHGPGVPVAEVTGLTDSLDLFVTVLELAGVAVPEPVRFARPVVAGGVPGPGKSEVFAEQHAFGPWKRWALVEAGKGAEDQPLKSVLAQQKEGERQVFVTYPKGLALEGTALNPAMAGDRHMESLQRLAYYRRILYEQRAWRP